MKKLVHYGGNGFDGCKEVAKYSVKHDSKLNDKYFNRFSKALQYYENLKGQGKAIWCIDGMPELLDCWTLD